MTIIGHAHWNLLTGTFDWCINHGEILLAQLVSFSLRSAPEGNRWDVIFSGREDGPFSTPQVQRVGPWEQEL